MCLYSMVKPKGFRVYLRRNPTLRKGICCETLLELREKICIKFPDIAQGIQTKIYTEDDTEVDDDEYLMALAPQSILIIGSLDHKKEEPLTPRNVFDNFLSLMRWSSGVDSVYQEVLDLMQEDFQSKWMMMKSRLEKCEEDLTLMSSKEQHPAWFSDLSTNARTKEEFMFKNCQARVRGYLAKAQTQLMEAKLLKSEEEKLAEQVIQQMKTRLKEMRFHGDYFCRTSEETSRICDSSGLFHCEGKYNSIDCTYTKDHTINPYTSQETRVLFSTWNLDHLVERSRSVVPALVEAIKTKKTKEKLNVEYFYSLLFTRANLKLVHIVCHDKGSHHGMSCDKRKFYIK